jgi:hypothetical protein
MKFYGIDIQNKFFVQIVSTVVGLAHAGATDEGRIVYNLTDDHLYTASQSTWNKIVISTDIYSNGTKQLFLNYPLPANWTIDAAHNDRMLVLSQNGSFANGIYGSWTITGISTTGNHNHGGYTGLPYGRTIYAGKSDREGYGGEDNHLHSMSTAGNHQHTFDGAWRPAYVNGIKATYSV